MSQCQVPVLENWKDSHLTAGLHRHRFIYTKPCFLFGLSVIWEFFCVRERPQYDKDFFLLSILYVWQQHIIPFRVIFYCMVRDT